MKKLLAGILTLSLALAACSNGDSGSDSKDSSNKDKSSSSDKAQDSNKGNKKNNDDSSKGDKDKDSKSKENNDSTTSNDSNQASNESNNDNNSDASSSSSSNNNSNSNTSGNDNSNVNNNTSANANANSSNSDTNASSQNGTANNSSNGKYVAPYQGQNAVPVAQNISSSNDNSQQALRNLPNFQTSLDQATNEVNSLNGQNNIYNDYAVEGSDGNYSYIFSFQNQAQPGTYAIATVDQQGTVRIVDPAYHQ